MKKLVLLSLLFLAQPAFAAEQPAKLAPTNPVTVAVPDFGKGLVFRPASGKTDDFIVLLSPSTGWSAEAAATAQDLANKGAIVLGLDVKAYYKSIAARHDECDYPSGIIEDQAQVLQKQSGGAYRQPTIIGLGDSGTLAMVTSMQTLPGTYKAAIAPSFCPSLNTAPRPLCLGSRLALKGKSYLPKDDKIAHTKTLHLALSQACAADKSWNAEEPVDAPQEFIADEVKATNEQETANAIPELADLPLTYLPGADNNDWLVVFISGDGGWRDIDRQVGSVLNKAGYSVIGVDSLRYFWHETTPQATATDIDRIITAASAAWHKPKVALAGYSFGADVMPFVYPHLETQKMVRNISLMGFGTDATFEITVGSYLGSGDSEYDTVKTLNKLKTPPVQCIYGEEEVPDDDTGCTHLANAEKIMLPGDHHFNEDYPRLAQIIIDRLRAAQ